VRKLWSAEFSPADFEAALQIGSPIDRLRQDRRWAKLDLRHFVIGLLDDLNAVEHIMVEDQLFGYKLLQPAGRRRGRDRANTPAGKTTRQTKPTKHGTARSPRRGSR
jgi:hypothetical protein